MMKIGHKRGSILIWTLLLGLSLATVFFFYSQRLNANVTSQRKTMEYQTANAFMESYADYLESLSLTDLEAIRDAGGIDFMGITGTLTNEVIEIEGKLDAGEESAEYAFTDTVDIEWNLCDENYMADLTLVDVGMVSETDYSNAGGPCLPSADYNDTETMVVLPDPGPFKIKSKGAPFYYRITSSTPYELVAGNTWYLDIEIPLGARKKITINRTFTP